MKEALKALQYLKWSADLGVTHPGTDPTDMEGFAWID